MTTEENGSLGLTKKSILAQLGYANVGRTPDSQYYCDGTDDDVQIQEALNAVGAAGGGVVYLKTGTYLLSQRILVPAYVCLEGEGWSTILTSTGADNHIISDNDINLNGINISNLSLNGAGGSEAGILLRGIDFRVTNCKFINFITGAAARGLNIGAGSGVVRDCLFNNIKYSIYLTASDKLLITGNRFYSTLAGNPLYSYQANNIQVMGNFFQGGADAEGIIELIDIEGGNHWTITGNTFKNGNIDGILIGGNPAAGTCTDINISGNDFNRCGYNAVAGRAAITFGSGIACTKTLVNNNTIDDCGVGIRVGEPGQTFVNKIKIHDNDIFNGSYGLVLYPGSAVDLKHNSFSSQSTAVVYQGAGVTLKAISNGGFITENSGIGTIASGATSQVITHGLNVTPTLKDISIILGELSTADPGQIYVDTITSTQFTVRCRTNPGISNLDFAWQAIVI